MITSFAAAVVAAVTGVAVIRTPGGNVQQIDVDANYVCEMAVAKLDENVNFFGSMKEMAKSSFFGGKKPTKYGQTQYSRREIEAVGELASAFDHVLGKHGFEPVEIHTYTTYNLDDNAGEKGNAHWNSPVKPRKLKPKTKSRQSFKNRIINEIVVLKDQ